MQKILILLAFTVPAFGAEPTPPVVKITPGKPVTVEAGKKCIIQVDTTAKKVTFKVPAGIDLVQLDGKRAAVWANPGTYKLLCLVPAGDDVLDTEIILTITGPRPPPDPDPKPDPVNPAPIPVSGNRVLIVYESGKTYPASVNSIIFGAKIRQYMNAKCVIGPDGKTPEWRIYDQDVDAASDSKLWGDAMKRKRDSVPWLVVSNGKSGFEGPLPATVDETLAILKKHLGE